MFVNLGALSWELEPKPIYMRNEQMLKPYGDCIRVSILKE